MTNAWYNAGLDGLNNGLLDWDTDTWDIEAVGSGYTFDAAAHSNWTTHCAAEQLTSAPTALTTIASTGGGVLDCDDVTIAQADLLSGTIKAFIIYHDATETLLAYIDTATGLPLGQTASQDITLRINGGPNKLGRT